MLIITCKKCGYIHTRETCENNPVMYQLILNNYANENRNELSIVINEDKQLTILDDPAMNSKLYLALNQEDNKITKLIYEMYKEKYILIKNQWYCYTGIIWKELTDEVLPIELLNAVEVVQEKIKELYIKHRDEQNLNYDELKLLCKITENLSKKLAKNNEDMSYISASKKYFSRPGLVFNEQSHLIAFQNGVYDLNTYTFRDGLPSDLLSIQLDYSYSEEDDAEKRKLLERFLEDILPAEDVREFLLMNIASCLLGQENIEQEFYILTGKKGSNGKSLLCSLIERTFGEYFAAPEPTLLTKSREKANEANEALKNLNGKRIAIMSEPNRKDRILSDNLKKFTGGDTLTVRGNHEKSMRMKMLLVFFMLCNGIPLLDFCEPAEIRRLCIINFPSRFCEKPTRKNEKLIDLTLSSKLKDCCSEFFKLLIKFLTKRREYSILGQKIPKPREVLKQLENYIQKNINDVDANQFIEQFLLYEDGKQLQCKDVWDRFTNWCIEESKVKIRQSELEDLVEKHFDNIEEKQRLNKGYVWYNINFTPVEQVVKIL